MQSWKARIGYQTTKLGTWKTSADSIIRRDRVFFLRRVFKIGYRHGGRIRGTRIYEDIRTRRMEVFLKQFLRRSHPAL
jgi:hypothetical protein